MKSVLSSTSDRNENSLLLNESTPENSISNNIFSKKPLVSSIRKVLNNIKEEKRKSKQISLPQEHNFLSETQNNDSTKKQMIRAVAAMNKAGLAKNVMGFVSKLTIGKKKTAKSMKLELSKKEKEIISQRFQRAFQIIKVMLRLMRISSDIRTYGTSYNLFDLTTRDRTYVKKVLYPLKEEEEIKKELSDKKKKDKISIFIIHPQSKFKLLWTPLMMVLLFYTATIMPYSLVFFDYDDNDFTNGWVIFQFLVDILYWMDIVVNMFSAYYNEEGILIDDFKIIVHGYLRGWFLIDIIACLPFQDLTQAIIDDETSSSSRLQLMKLSRLPRIYRLVKLTKIIKVLRFISNNSMIAEYFEVNSGLMRLMTLLFSVCILIHLMGCLWFYLAKWDDFGPDTWVFRNNLQDSNDLSLYMASIYFALTTLATVGYGDIVPKTHVEMIISIILMLFGVGVYSFTIGILSSVLAYIDTKASSLGKKIAIMNEFCNDMKITKSLKDRLRKTLEYNTNKNSFSWAEKTNIFTDLPINLQYDIVMNVHDKIISEIFFFKNCGDKFFVVRTVPLLKPLFFKNMEAVWRKGNNPDSIYFLVTGKINFVGEFEEEVKNKPWESNTIDYTDKKHFIFKTMIPGSYFGEIEILFRSKREFTVTCESETELFYLSRYDFESILEKEFPHIIDQMKVVAKKRLTINRQSCNNVLRKFKDQEKKLILQQSSTLPTSQEKTGEISKRNPSLVKTLSKKISSGFQRLSKKSSQIMPYDKIKDANAVPKRNTKKSFDISSFNNESPNFKSSSSHSSEGEEDENSSGESSEKISENEKDEESNGKSKSPQKSLGSEESVGNKKTKQNEQNAVEELTYMKTEIRKNQERQNQLESKIKEIKSTLDTTFDLVKNIIGENLK